MGICGSVPGWEEAGERVEIMWDLFYALLRLHPFTRQVKFPIHNLMSFSHSRVFLFVTFYLFFRLPSLAGNELGVVAPALAYFLARLPPAATADSTLSPSLSYAAELPFICFSTHRCFQNSYFFPICSSLSYLLSYFSLNHKKHCCMLYLQMKTTNTAI